MTSQKHDPERDMMKLVNDMLRQEVRAMPIAARLRSIQDDRRFLERTAGRTGLVVTVDRTNALLRIARTRASLKQDRQIQD